MNLARLAAYGLVILLMAGMLTFIGCNEPDEFDADELFSLEDMAYDWHYAMELYNMMNRWRNAHEIAVTNLGGTPGAVPFSEILPMGWSEIEMIDLGEGQYSYDWFIRSSPNAANEYLRFDHNVTPPTDIHPIKAEYFSFKRDSGYVENLEKVLLTTYTDSMSMVYTASGMNITKMEGEALYLNIAALFFSDGFIPEGAMVNEWRASITDMITEPGNLAGIYDIQGTTTIINIQERVVLNVQIDLEMRANSTGEASIWVEGEKRIIADFSGFDTRFRGDFYMSTDGFTQPITFNIFD